MTTSNGFWTSRGFRRLVVLVFLIAFFYLMRKLLNLFLLTFIFTFLMYRIQSFLSNRLRRIMRVEQRMMVVLLYVLMAALIAFALYKYIPLLVEESVQVINQIADFYRQMSQDPSNPYLRYLMTNFKQINISGYLNQGFNILVTSISSVGRWGLNFLLAVLLSLYFLLDKNRVIHFTAKFERSNIGPYYHELAVLGEKFINTFGKVIEVQILIAFINSVLSVIALWLMGFPQVLGLGIMILILGLIPVAGVLISLIPLCIIAFKIGGLIHIIYVVVMIVILHALESYILNPRLMSSKTKLPVFYTLIILIVSEYLMGLWGLIIGIPIFMFLLDLLEVKNIR